jgi:hypothetical protein
MELHESIYAPTLAHKLGETLHISPLFRKVVQSCGSTERAGDWLLKIAVQRGARHYKRDFDSALPPDDPSLSDEEVGVALCLGHLPDRPVFIRAASQLLSSPKINVHKVARLAAMERCEPVIAYIADAAARYAPGVEPWASLRPMLSRRKTPPEDSLPHWSRFVSMTGVTEKGGPQIDWLMRYE